MGFPASEEARAETGAAGRLKILAVVSYFPTPQNHGDALRRLMVLQALNDMGDLTVAAAKRIGTVEADIDELSSALPGARLLIGDLAPEAGSSATAKLRRTIRGAVKRRPPWLDQQWSPELYSSLQALSGEQFDVSVLIGEASGLYVGALPASRVVWDKSNVLFATEVATVFSRESPSARLRALVTMPLTRRFERSVLAEVDTVWVTSDEEGDRLLRFFGRSPGAVIPSSVPLGGAPAEVDPTGATAVWMSTLSYGPNWDGLRRFLRANSAELERRGIRLRVIGAGGSARHERVLAQYPAVDYIGYADDLRAAFSGAAYAIVPVWSGAGVKLKTLTFMSLGVPVISTPVGLEGIPHEAATAVFDQPADFSRVVGDLSPERLQVAAARGRAITADHFSPERFTTRVVDAVRSVVQPVGGSAR